jgi:BolA protein
MTADQLRTRLAQHINTTSIEVIDQSAAHAGHRGNTGGGYFDVKIVSPEFEGLSRVARHQKVYAVVGGMIGKEIHALSIVAITPHEN